MPNCKIIKYKDRDIVYVDHRGLNTEELLENLKYANNFLLNTPGDKLLTLANFENTFLNEEIMNLLKSKETEKVMEKVDKSAVVGILGIKKILLNTYNRFTGNKTRAFKTEEEAKEYLVP